MTTPRRRLRCGSAILFASIISAAFMASANAEQYSVVVPEFRLTLFPVTSDFDKKSARNILSIAAETAQSYLGNQLANRGVTIDVVSFDLRSWSFHDHTRQRNLRGGDGDGDTSGERRHTAECTVCTDEPTENMARRGITCPKAYDAVDKRCREDPYWVEHRACEYSCWLEGRSYTDTKECCDPNAPPPQEPEDKREVMIKSEQPIGGYVVVTADSPSDLPDQLGLFSLITSSLFPGADEEADVGDRDDSVFVDALNEKLTFPINIKRGSFYAVETPKEGVSGLVTESTTSSPPTAKPSRPVTPSPTRSPVKNTDEPTAAPTRRPTKPLRTEQPTTEGTLSEIDAAASEDMGDNEIDSTPAPSPNDYVSKATDGGGSTNGNSGSNTTLMAAAVVTSFAVLLLGAFFVHRRRRNQKEYDTTATSGEGGAGSSTTRTNINGNKSTQLRNLDALHAYDDGSLGGDAYRFDDEDNKTLDTSRNTAPEDCNDIVADLVGGGADIAIHTGTKSQTNRPLLLNIPEGSVSVDDDTATAPLSPSSLISPTASSPTSIFRPSDEPTSPTSLKMIEPKIVVSPKRLSATTSAPVTEEKKMDEDRVPITLPTKVPPLIPLTLGRVSSLEKEVEFEQPTFEPSEWDFNDNDADSMHSSDATSTNDPFITPDHMQLRDEDSLISPFPPPCSSIGSPESACTTNSRKTYYNHEYAYNDDESSSAASILFTVLGRKGGRKKNTSRNDEDETENRDSEFDDDPDRFSTRNWNDIAFV